jgi:hypothetical protein
MRRSAGSRNEAEKVRPGALRGSSGALEMCTLELDVAVDREIDGELEGAAEGVREWLGFAVTERAESDVKVRECLGRIESDHDAPNAEVSPSIHIGGAVCRDSDCAREGADKQLTFLSSLYLTKIDVSFQL